jgi:hypothetical protein
LIHNETAGGKMPEIITYSLRGDNNNSDEYYRTISLFCDEVLALDGEHGSGRLEAFLKWCKQNPRVPGRNQGEALHEMLSLGVLWRIYGPTAIHSNKTWRRLSAWLVNLREHSKLLKGAVDHVRGWLGGFFQHKPNGGKLASPSLKEVYILLDWLAASGEFSEVVRRLATWREFLSSLDDRDFKGALQDITDLADWFERRSLERLGKFTENVEGFLAGKHALHRWQEDYIFTGRRRVEYHLNMLGTELLNRSLRAGFLETHRKIVIVPPCMKAKPEEECQAKMTPYGERCANCTPGCRVNQVTRLGEKKGFAVFIIPDDLKTFSSDSHETGNRQAVGLVGVSCPLTNTSGGWEMKRLGVPAQGLLLDYCGCIWHWHKEGIPTDINFNQLVRLMDFEG